MVRWLRSLTPAAYFNKLPGIDELAAFPKSEILRIEIKFKEAKQ